MLENTGGNNHSPKITPTTLAFVFERARGPQNLQERLHLEGVNNSELALKQ